MDGSDTFFQVTAKSDHLARQASAPPLMALAECVWNAVDADAMRVEIEFQDGPLGGLERIVVRDDGTGMNRDEAPGLFAGLGGSWKSLAAKTKGRGRFLHGREGRGRFKAFALGRVADWSVTFRDGKALKVFKITVLGTSLDKGRITEATDCVDTATGTGVELVITELLRDFRSLSGEDGRQSLTEILAPYLLSYPEVRVSVNGLLLDPEEGIAHRKAYSLKPVEEEGTTHSVTLEVIEWKRAGERCLYLCGERGFPLLTLEERLPPADRGYCAYLRSSFIQALHDKNELGLGGLNVPLQEVLVEARQAIRDHLRRRAAADSQNVVEAWKREDVYPYKDSASNPLEQAKRDVFDIVAVTAARHIEDFDKTSQKARRLQLRTLRAAVEQGDEEIQTVLQEVLNLQKKELADLVALLRETSLSALIGGARVISNRLKVLTGLEALVFEDDYRKTLRERTQLHRLVAENTWLFGDEFQLMADDEGLTRCLAEHAKARGVQVLGSDPVLHPEKKRGIVDLMFGKQRRPHGSADIEHLIVELKAPKVPIRQKELTQVENYAQAVAADSRFDKATTRWVFWALSRKIDDDYCGLRQIKHAPDGVVVESGNIVIWVRTWASLFKENRARLKFFQDSLDLRITREGALEHLRTTYGKYLEGVLVAAAEEPAGFGEHASASRASRTGKSTGARRRRTDGVAAP